jgi:hypothetical protein
VGDDVTVGVCEVVDQNFFDSEIEVRFFVPWRLCAASKPCKCMPALQKGSALEFESKEIVLGRCKDKRLPGQVSC